MTQESTPTPRSSRRAQRIVAAGFLGAFGLTIVTVLLTGLAVRSHTVAEQAARDEPAAAIRDQEAVEPAETAAPVPADDQDADREPRDPTVGESPDRQRELEGSPR
jgi:hypothetical protein